MDSKKFKVDKTWSLFLDRDGVINVKREADYVKTIPEFIFIDGAKESVANFTSLFGKLFLVTNQQGIGKGIMTDGDLEMIHNYMHRELQKIGGKLDEMYYCPNLAADNSPFRKPNIGMALQAKIEFPEVNFEKSILVGDSVSDIEMGKNAGMKTVFIHSDLENPANADLVVTSLKELSILLENS